jgi:succinate dehydrogenase / fumarate reductase cytochrome b subunit
MWAWLLQRVTGLALVGYVFVHIWVVSSATVSGMAFDDIMAFFQKPVFIALDVLLLLAVLAHGINGMRIVLFDFGVGVRIHKTLLAVAVVLMLALTIYGLVEALPYIMGEPLRMPSAG